MEPGPRPGRTWEAVIRQKRGENRGRRGDGCGTRPGAESQSSAPPPGLRGPINLSVPKLKPWSPRHKGFVWGEGHVPNLGAAAEETDALKATWATNWRKKLPASQLGSIPGLTQWVGDPALLWLWCRLAAVAPIRPLAWELLYAMDTALKSKKKTKGKKRSPNLNPDS